ncbi:MAG: hypothetical protein HN919_06250 [Verrucomicrobia bacterium]|jgi:hypothetical protein|nr:hypothetical protein [Verrucomicrobiota bacterium]MBT7065883.1 hypothetical protein [Verrucomicrobiota bacterium]MBT7701117.1 hypothetical protein [Verrucomicrobiota bacterium]
MKRILSILAVVALVAMTVQAVEVKSENVAGVINVSVDAAEYKLIGMSLDDIETLDPTLADVLGTDGVPDGTVVYIFNGLGYDPHIYYDGFGWYEGADLSTAVVDRVTGFWVKCPAAHTFSLTGEVPDYDTTMTLGEGYQIVNYPFPAAVALTDSVIGTTAADGDKIYVLDGTDYVPHIYYAGFGWYDGPDLSTLVFNPGDSFWYQRVGTGEVSFDETVPYTL